MDSAQPTDSGQPDGGELLAYGLHHLQQRHWVILIPDDWMVLIAAIVDKRLNRVRSRRLWPPYDWDVVCSAA